MGWRLVKKDLKVFLSIYYYGSTNKKKKNVTYYFSNFISNRIDIILYHGTIIISLLLKPVFIKMESFKGKVELSGAILRFPKLKDLTVHYK